MTDPRLTGRSAAPTQFRFVTSAREFDSSFEGTTIVLDPGWVPLPGNDPRIISPLPAFDRVLRQHDLFAESLDLVNAWADRVGIVDRLMVEGVSYWFRVRETMWHWIHERLLWRHTLAIEGIGEPHGTVALPSTEEAIFEVATAMIGSGSIQAVSVPTAPTPRLTPREAMVRLLPSQIRSTYRRIRPHPEVVRMERERERDREREIERNLARRAFLDDRVRGLTPLEGRVLIISQPQSRQVVGVGLAASRADPNLGSIYPALAEAGLPTLTIGWAVPRESDDLWQVVQAEPTLLPGYFLRDRWGRPDDEARVEMVLAQIRQRLADLDTQLLLDGVDVTEPFAAALASTAVQVITEDVRDLASIERVLEELSPRAIVMSQEGHRTPWLMAAASRGVPTFAVQHGVLYERHPGYPDARDRRHILPSKTFVFGDFERRVLRGIGYLDHEIEVSGCPRLDLHRAWSTSETAAEIRSAIRQQIGVAESDRLLVVSTGWYPFMRQSHIAQMLASLLAGPLPGVHVVFKQHLGERDDGPYRSLVASLANAGGYEPPKMTVIRDIDLYALLTAADAHLGHQSTVLSDAIVVDACNLVAGVQASPPMLDYVGLNVGTRVENVEQLRAALLNPPRAPEVARRAFLEDHFRSGHAGRRIASAIATASPRMQPAGTRPVQEAAN